MRDLKVISRSGVAAYRGKNRNMKQIGRDLGVANVLEGSLQISGDRVRINAQLIDTQTDSQIWAEQYDRKLEDIFALQSELAQTIAGQLKATLSTGEKAEIWRQPTQDLQAYDLYLRARAAFRAGSGILPRENWNVAIDLLNRAIARDPKFTLAYCLLNEAYVLQYRYGEDHSPAASRCRKRCCGDSAAARANSRRTAPCSCSILLSWVERLSPDGSRNYRGFLLPRLMKLSSLPWLHWSNAVWDNLRHRFATARKRLSLILRMCGSLLVSRRRIRG